MLTLKLTEDIELMAKTKKAQGNVDIGNLPSDMVERTADMDIQFENGREAVEFISLSELLDELETQLFEHGYQLKPSAGGKWCMCNLFARASLKGIKGLSIPNDFFYWQKQDHTNEQHRKAFLKTLKMVCEDKASETSSEGIQGMWKTVYKSFADRMAVPSNAISSVILGRLSTAAETGKVTLSGKPGAFKVVPQVSWFSDNIQAINARDLITIMDDAEADQLMLILGRAMVGATETEALEGMVEHSFRSYGVIISEPGLGKSTLLYKYLGRVMGYLGYSIAEIAQSDSRFGWAEAATADLATFDDLVEETQVRLFKRVEVKSIVSNGLINVEEKGQPRYTVRATSAIIGCSNTSNYAMYIGMDEGSINRLNQLGCRSKKEVEKLYAEAGVCPDGRIKEYWEWLSEKLEVTPMTLAAYFLARCAEYFLNTGGMTIDDGILVKNWKEDRLEQVIYSNRAKFRIDTNLRHAEELPNTVGHIVAMAIADKKDFDQQDMLEQLQHLGFSPELVTLALQMLVQEKRMPEWAVEGVIKHASKDTKRYASGKIQEMEGFKASTSLDRAFTQVISELSSNKGFSYPSRQSYYTPIWKEVVRSIPDLVAHYTKVMDGVRKPQELQAVLQGVQNIFTQL